MTNKLRSIAIALTVSIFASISMSGCAQQKQAETTSTANAATANASTANASTANVAIAKADEKPVDLIFLTQGDAAAKPLTSDDRIIAEINKRLGINLKVKFYAQVDFQKVYVSMASGDMADVMTTEYPTQQVNSWVKDGLILPLNDYFSEMPTVAQKLNDKYKWTAVNGKFYGYTFLEEGSNMTLFYRPDWLQKLGLNPPQTLDDFYAVSKAIVNNDPDGNGKNDTYALTGGKFTASDKPNSGTFCGNFGFIFHAFGLKSEDWATDSSGNVIPIFETKEFKDAMAYLQKMYAEKLIDPDFLLNDGPAMEQKLFQNKIGFVAMPGFRNWGRIKNSFLQVNPGAQLGYLKDFIAGPGGQKGSNPNAKTGLITSITSNAKDPVKAAKFIELLLSPSGRDLLQNGIEGIHYTKGSDGKIVYNEQERAKDNFSPNGWSHVLAWGSVMWPLTVQYIPDSDPDKAEDVDTAKIATKCMVTNLIPYFTDAELKPNQLGTINQEYFTKIITGGVGVDAGLAEWSKKWRAGGGEDLLKSLTEEYKKLKG